MMPYSVAKNPYMVINKRFKTLLLLLAILTANFIFYGVRQHTTKKDETFRTRGISELEEMYWKVEEKYRNIVLNLRHRADFVRDAFEAVLYHNRLHGGDRLIKKPIDHFLIAHSKRTNFFVQDCEKLLAFNKFKKKRLDEIAERIRSRVDQLQNTKCHVSKVLACSLEQDCGYACLFHHIGVCLIISYYTDRTMVIVKTNKKGIGKFNDIFWPVTNSCRFDQQELAEIQRQAIRPLVLVHQEENGRGAFLKYEQDIKEIAKYHSEPIGFFNSHLLSYILRYNKSASFYKTLLNSRSKFNLTHPYVGIHIRRSDKSNEAKFYEPEDYMRHVDAFYERYFRNHPHMIATTKRTVYVASDDDQMFSTIKTKYRNYTFHYNNSFTSIAGNEFMRYSQEGFESLLFDVFFLSNSDFVVCTFSSNVCRLSYELILARSQDLERQFHSLDTPYYHISDAKFFKMAILPSSKNNKDPTKDLRKGDLFHRRLVSGHDYEEYHQNGFHCGWNYRTRYRELFPSFKLKNVYF